MRPRYLQTSLPIRSVRPGANLSADKTTIRECRGWSEATLVAYGMPSISNAGDTRK
ncbi:hypothetical protein DPMN_029484 [Dreissena polymorpha]|uniref:Uncharacterized protein n=1 Tax=Dreissena polymorpha TaxID=45954 RepID=A0A9D4LYN3_DREPO|nr:hypothetical protein DPMN_029484 [Dreissena polymorpha]